MKKIIILGGPTASGKSKLALDIAKEINGEIINGDSMQVYKNFSILTSQPKLYDLELVSHHLYGYVETNKNYNAIKWLKDTKLKIELIFKRDKTPIVVGGSGLYLEFLYKGVSKMPKISYQTVQKVKLLLKTIKDDDLLSLIMEIDNKYSEKINIADKFRITKLLEVYYETKKNISYFHNKQEVTNKHKCFKVFMCPNKNKVKINIKNRLFEMIEEGLINEINIHKNKVRNCNIEKAIGYKEINNYLEGKVSLEEATNLVLSKTKKFAKRQYTWFENRYEENLKIRSNVNPSLVVESFNKII
jgi:tRNA dimethylallyltransferase